ncbi:probable UDP-sugar transporter protein SLC35A5 [Lytechinus variegatus]|uniref:probable UDP-sugar transporter protein SLC35A5 n=1 Tax=Lytechinus variegatus TaxID=7654 RepID=UPI001BB221DB|nr:probable UDP-sugar transporter protein SLC35A5 [Lytechinus variegatus]
MEYSSTTTVALAAVYIVLGAGRVMLMRLSANEDHKYDYLPVTVNVCAEAVKLVVCLSIMLKLEMSGKPLFKEFIQFSWPECLRFFKWSIPGLLYFLDNLIGFSVMTFFEPAVAVLLGNFTIISTSLLFRLILKRKFSRVQWASLLILFLAIVSLSNQDHRSSVRGHHHTSATLESIDNATLYEVEILQKRHAIPSDLCHRQLRHTSEPSNSEASKYSFTVSFGHVLIVVQCFLSSFANIYNEKIFKEGHNEQGLHMYIVQNTRLYTFGVIFNTLTLLVIPNFRNRVIYCGMFSGYTWYSTLLIFATAALGLTISLMLKFRDNMFHVHSAQVTTVVIISLSIWLTGFQPTLDFFLQMPTVFLAIFIYNNSHVPAEPALTPRRRYPSETVSRGQDKSVRKRGTSVSEELIELTRVDGEDETSSVE